MSQVVIYRTTGELHKTSLNYVSLVPFLFMCLSVCLSVCLSFCIFCSVLVSVCYCIISAGTCAIEFFTISPRYKSGNIANFVLAMPFKIKETNKVNEACPLERYSLSPNDI